MVLFPLISCSFLFDCFWLVVASGPVAEGKNQQNWLCYIKELMVTVFKPKPTVRPMS